MRFPRQLIFLLTLCSGHVNVTIGMIQREENLWMKFDYETAIEMGNALLDAAELAKAHNEDVTLTTTKNNKWIALIGEPDCGTRLFVEPPIPEPDEPKLKAIA